MNTWPLLNSLGVVGLWSLFGFLVLTRKLTWHTDLEAMREERDHWRDIALRGLGVAEKSTTHAETLVQQVTPESAS